FYLLYFVLFIAIYSCKKENKPIVDPPIITPDSAAFTSVVLEAKNNAGKLTADITCNITGNEITAVIPSMQNDRKLVVTFATINAGTVVKVNDTLQVSGTTLTDFNKPVTYAVTTPKGVTQNYTFKIKNFTGIPIFYLTTSGPVVSKDDYVTGTLVINTNNEYEQEKLTIPLQIKGRGNATWVLPKKPYRLKFDTKAAMLGLPAAKNWVLLANYNDKSLLRTSAAFKLGQMVGADFTNHGRAVEVVMNGEYLGSYLLTEQVEVNDDRVDIPEIDADDVSGEKLTGGYLLEFDYRLDEEFWFKTAGGAPFTIKSPEDIEPQQLAYITNYIQDFENSVISPDFADPVNGYAKYINTDSFIKWCVVEELMRNTDARNFSSIFYYKDRNGKLGMCSVWDFDNSGGNLKYDCADVSAGWWISKGPYFQRMFKDPAFKAKFAQEWNELKAKLPELYTYIDDAAQYLNLSQQENFKRWNILNEDICATTPLGTYNKEVEYLKAWLVKRASWIDANLATVGE
ncbi:MAG: hypothetical protein EOP54_23120, partial [Sphingobacteriales bacterium]